MRPERENPVQARGVLAALVSFLVLALAAHGCTWQELRTRRAPAPTVAPATAFPATLGVTANPAAVPPAPASEPEAPADLGGEPAAAPSPGELRGRILAPTSRPSSLPRLVSARTVAGDGAPAGPLLPWRCDGRGLVPAVLTVAVGQPLRIVNHDVVCHRFFSTAVDNRVDLGSILPGAAADVTFVRPGIVHLYCSLHTGRQATVVVAPSPRFAVADAEGRFAIAALPPGDYVVEFVGDDVEAEPVSLTVEPGRVEFIEIQTRTRGCRSR